MKFLCCFVVLLEILGILVLRVSSNCALDLPSGKLIEVGSGSLTIAEGDILWDLCDGLQNEGECKGAAVCQVKQDGTMINLGIDPHHLSQVSDEEATLVLGGGGTDGCPEGKKRETQISLSCAPTAFSSFEKKNDCLFSLNLGAPGHCDEAPPRSLRQSFSDRQRERGFDSKKTKEHYLTRLKEFKERKKSELPLPKVKEGRDREEQEEKKPTYSESEIQETIQEAERAFSKLQKILAIHETIPLPQETKKKEEISDDGEPVACRMALPLDHYLQLQSGTLRSDGQTFQWNLCEGGIQKRGVCFGASVCLTSSSGIDFVGGKYPPAGVHLMNNTITIELEGGSRKDGCQKDIKTKIAFKCQPLLNKSVQETEDCSYLIELGSLKHCPKRIPKTPTKAHNVFQAVQKTTPGDCLEKEIAQKSHCSKGETYGCLKNGVWVSSLCKGLFQCANGKKVHCRSRGPKVTCPCP